MTDLLLYGGKGGVGKTTCAAATALALADRGERTLVVSTDPAHSLSDSFGREDTFGPEPVEVRANLDAAEVDPAERAERYRALLEALADDVRELGVRVDSEDVERVFGAGTGPGSDELAAIDTVADFLDAGYDHLVLDTAPTGHTLRLLSLPDILATALGTTAQLRKRLKRTADTAKSFVVGPAAFLGRDEDEDGFEALKSRVERVGEVLRDPEYTAFRVVTTPEGMAIAETERLVADLQEMDIPVGGVVVNRVLETVEDDCSRCRTRQARHEDRVAEVRDRFPDIPVWVLPELDGEAQGLDALASLAERVEA